MLLLEAMEFGKLSDLNGVKWDLPEDDQRNISRFVEGEPKIYFGAPGWSVKYWRGKIYPRDCEPEKFLYHYSRQYNAIELNTTHYRIPTPDLTREWRAAVPPHFQFCSKIPQSISHAPSGMRDKELLRTWYEYLGNLGENSGPSFIQFPEYFSYSEKMLLFKFLESWPSEFKLTLEFRHSSWFKENKVLPALTDYLHSKGMGLVITDVAGRRDVLHCSVTADWTMIRLIGNDLDPSDEKRLRDWSQRINQWRQNGPKQIYLFLHQPDDNWTVEFSRMARDVFTQMDFKDIPTFILEEPRDLFSVSNTSD